MTDHGPGRALLAAGALGLLYEAGGVARTLAGLILLSLLLLPGPTGTPALAGMLNALSSVLTGEDMKGKK